MTAPACPQLAKELTANILETDFTDDIPIERYQAYIWLMHVLLSGGWVDFEGDKYAPARDWLKGELKIWDALQPWLTPKEYSQDDIAAHLVDRALFDNAPS